MTSKQKTSVYHDRYEEDEIDLKELFNTIKKNKSIIVFSMIIALTFASIHLYFKQNTQESYAQVALTLADIALIKQTLREQ